MNAPVESDVAIVGAGLVGASLALALSGLGLEVVLIEARAPAPGRRLPGRDARAIALSAGSRIILQALGVWEALDAAAAPILRIHVSDRGRFGFAHLDHRREGLRALGYVVPAQVLGEVLLAHLDTRPVHRRTARLVRLHEAAGGWELGLEDGTGEGRLRLHTRLLVGADGTDSTVRALLGIARRVRDYGQAAVIAEVLPSDDHGGTAFERFTEQGPLALLPLVDGRCALVWTHAAESAAQRLQQPEAAFLDDLQAAFGWRLGRFRALGPRALHPLRRVEAVEAVRPRAVLVGNAAHTLHPVAGQGFNLGLRDVAVLAERIAQAVEAGEDPGGRAVTEGYARWRAGDQRRVLAFTELLLRTFASPMPPVRAARDAAMLGLDLCPPLRHLFTRLTTGRLGRLPRLARGVPLAPIAEASG
ncbi:MAG: 2-octaprenyl-6-methoxyphenyl hydroxylase [Gammaproteobacteria bacterium]|nr:MAG: 2-octaprenyl-6-methoxyphenyl hydroxylase [Gammaproteobacteria bacterium]